MAHFIDKLQVLLKAIVTFCRFLCLFTIKHHEVNNKFKIQPKRHKFQRIFLLFLTLLLIYMKCKLIRDYTHQSFFISICVSLYKILDVLQILLIIFSAVNLEHSHIKVLNEITQINVTTINKRSTRLFQPKLLLFFMSFLAIFDHAFLITTYIVDENNVISYFYLFAHFIQIATYWYYVVVNLFIYIFMLILNQNFDYCFTKCTKLYGQLHYLCKLIDEIFHPFALLSIARYFLLSFLNLLQIYDSNSSTLLAVFKLIYIFLKLVVFVAVPNEIMYQVTIFNVGVILKYCAIMYKFRQINIK